LKQVFVLADAAEDLEAARDFYNAREAGVGEYCVDSLLADIESLGLFSGIHPLHFNFHRMLASRFPFGIYYREHGDETQVFAILDLRRNPSWIRRELGKRGAEE
jgi:plasmid stabilization system protein ParE